MAKRSTLHHYFHHSLIHKIRENSASPKFSSGETNGVWGEEVLEDGLTAEEFDVDDHGEVDVQDDVVVDGQPKQEAD